MNEKTNREDIKIVSHVIIYQSILYEDTLLEATVPIIRSYLNKIIINFKK